MMLKFDFKDCTLEEQIEYTYEWFNDHTFNREYQHHYAMSLPMDLVLLNKNFYELILRHYIINHDKCDNYIKEMEQDIMTFIKTNEVKTIEEIKGSVLTLFKLQVLK